MLSLVLTLLVLVVIFFIQRSYPLLAGILAVAPVKIIATAAMTYEDGGVSRLHDSDWRHAYRDGRLGHFVAGRLACSQVERNAAWA